MKKFFAIAAVAAMLIACGEPEENKPQGGNNNGGTEQPEPEVPEFKAAITVDGNFADWEGLEVDELALEEGEEYGKAELKKVKFYTDEMYINIYAEYDPTNAMALCIYLDVDADATTGRAEPCQGIELYLDGTIAEWSLNEAGDTFIEPRISALAPDCAVHKFTGDDGTAGWNWETDILGAGNGFAVGCTPVPVGANEAFEMAIVKELCPIALGEEVGIAVSITGYDWAEHGTLPQYSVAETEAGAEGRAACHVIAL